MMRAAVIVLFLAGCTAPAPLPVASATALPKPATPKAVIQAERTRRAASQRIMLAKSDAVPSELLRVMDLNRRLQRATARARQHPTKANIAAVRQADAAVRAEIGKTRGARAPSKTSETQE